MELNVFSIIIFSSTALFLLYQSGACTFNFFLKLKNCIRSFFQVLEREYRKSDIIEFKDTNKIHMMKLSYRPPRDYLIRTCDFTNLFLDKSDGVTERAENFNRKVKGEETKKDGRLVMIPMDCWNHILKNFSSQHDFLSVMKVVPGLLEYMQSCNNGTATSSIQFVLKKMPVVDIHYVRKLSISNDCIVRSRWLVKRKYKKKRKPGFLHDLFKSFHNLEDITIRYLSFQVFEMKGISNQVIRINTFEESFLYPTLRKLSLFVSVGKILINSTNFPNLEKLRIIRFQEAANCKSSKIRGYCSRTRVLSSPVLTVNWKNFPKLSYLFLVGVFVSNDLSPLRNELETLTIANSRITSPLQGFKKLRSLFLIGNSVALVYGPEKMLIDLPLLETLELRCHHKFNGPIYVFEIFKLQEFSNLQYTKPLQIDIVDLPSLKHLAIYNNGDEDINLINRWLKISKTPKLENLFLRECYFPVRVDLPFSNSPLENIHFGRSHDVVVSHFGETSVRRDFYNYQKRDKVVIRNLSKYRRFKWTRDYNTQKGSVYLELSHCENLRDVVISSRYPQEVSHRDKLELNLEDLPSCKRLELHFGIYGIITDYRIFNVPNITLLLLDLRQGVGKAGFVIDGRTFPSLKKLYVIDSSSKRMERSHTARVGGLRGLNNLTLIDIKGLRGMQVERVFGFVANDMDHDAILVKFEVLTKFGHSLEKLRKESTLKEYLILVKIRIADCIRMLERMKRKRRASLEQIDSINSFTEEEGMN